MKLGYEEENSCGQRTRLIETRTCIYAVCKFNDAQLIFHRIARTLSARESIFETGLDKFRSSDFVSKRCCVGDDRSYCCRIALTAPKHTQTITSLLQVFLGASGYFLWWGLRPTDCSIRSLSSQHVDRQGVARVCYACKLQPRKLEYQLQRQ